MTNKTIKFTEKKILTCQLAILGIIFIGRGLIVPIQEVLEKLNTAKDANSPKTQKEIQPLLIEAKRMIDEFKDRQDHYAKKYNFQGVYN